MKKKLVIEDDNQQNVLPTPKTTAKRNRKNTICNNNTIQESTVINEDLDEGSGEEVNVQELIVTANSLINNF
ncbi:9597_t:CDS:2 [Funneliformis caledonium]|uniref:9597_t:CDS:1 n=1 Tax=Funneliformis caledonium TaxID=1117310 RepID=A0A9N9FF83_9GLOM|nr:9597_t:CDS:2 [Funneliformis caledonium]